MAVVLEKGQFGKRVVIDMLFVNTLVRGTFSLCLFSILCQFTFCKYNKKKC